MTIDISAHDALRSEYLYTYIGLAVATLIGVALVVPRDKLAWILCLILVIIPYAIGAFCAAFLWNENNSQRLFIRFPYGKSNPTVFTNIETQILSIFVGICIGIVGISYYFYEDPYIGLIITAVMFFALIQQLLLVSAVNRSATMYMAPMFFVLIAFVFPVLYCRYKDKWEDVSVLDKLDWDGYPLPEYKADILKHFKNRAEFRVEKSSRHIGDAIL